MIEWVVYPILVLLVATALMIARLKDLWAAIMATGIYSFLGASWMLMLDAPDVAFTEAAVGAGISTVLLLTTISLTGCRMRPATTGRAITGLVVVGITGAALIYGTLDMPAFGDPNAPVQTYPSPAFVDRAQGDMHGLPNVVTAVLASYRGYDTLGETTVILTAGLSVMIILGSRRNTTASPKAPASPNAPTVTEEVS